MTETPFAETVNSERDFRVLADNAPVMIWRSAPDKLCDWFNLPWLQFTGRTMEQELGNGWAEGVHPDDFSRCLSIYTAAFNIRKEFSMEYRLRRHDEIYRWVLDNGRPYFSPDGTFRGYFGSCIDVTEMRHAQEALRVSQAEFARVARLTTMGEMAASIAHEINTPLAAIVANGNACLRLLANGTRHLDEARAALQSIVTDGHRAGQIINSIRAMLKKDTQKRAWLDVNGLIREILVLVHSDLDHRQVAVRTELTKELPQVCADRIQLQQVLLNLIVNAIEAMDTLSNRARVLCVKSEIDGSNGVLITVEDSGTGVGLKDIERIFDAFFTTKSQGMGLGLSICRSIIEAHNGRILVSSGIHGGSVFQVVLPNDRSAV